MVVTNEELYDNLIKQFLDTVDTNNPTNEELLIDTFKQFKDKIECGDVTIDKTGVKTVEILGWQCKHLNPWQPLLSFNDKSTSRTYCEKELQWYLSQDLHVTEIQKYAKIWSQIASSNNEVNSNYGWCIFNKDNHNQYDNVVEELIANNNSRRAVMIYTRPSMWYDYDKDGMQDFICTWGTHVFIRNSRLFYIINQRSCDIWFGLRNDFVFHCFVYQMLFNTLIDAGIKLTKDKTTIIYNCDTIHLYERHFDLCKSIC